MKRRINKKNLERKIIYTIITLMLSLVIYYINTSGILMINQISSRYEKKEISFEIGDIPEYTNKAYVVINNNQPQITKEDEELNPVEQYGKLDSLGRCTVAIAKVGIETMPIEERKSISSIKPSGWKTAKYDIIDGKYLYNRCHLIGYQLTGENDNKENLITGTQYLNVEGMLLFENKVAEYIKKTGNHVMYRVTPIFEKDNLLASGVNMEAKSIEDFGEGICFNVYVYNVQPGIEIDYATGVSKLKE